MDPQAAKSSEVPSATSGGNHKNLRGVRTKDGFSWESRVGRLHLGTFPSSKMAAVAYDVGADALQGDRAAPNFPQFREIWPKPKSNSHADIKEAAVNAAKLYDNVIGALDTTSANPLDNSEGESSQGPGNHQNYGSRPPHPNQQSQPASSYHPYRRDQTARTSGRGSSWDQRPLLARNQQRRTHGYRAPNPYQQNAAAQYYGQPAFQYGFERQPYSAMPQQGLVPGVAAQQQNPYAHAVGPYGQAYSPPAGADGNNQSGQLAPGYRQAGPSNNPPGWGYWPMMPASGLSNIPVYSQQGQVPGGNPDALGQYGQVYSQPAGTDGNSQYGQLAPGYRQVGPPNNLPGWGYWPMMPASGPSNILVYPQQGQVPGGSHQGIVQPAAAGSGAPVVGGRLIPGTQTGVEQESSESQEGSDP